MTENPAPALPPRPVEAVRDRTRARSPLTNEIFADTTLIVAFRSIRPSWRNYIEYVDYSARNGDVDMRRYLTFYLALTAKERKAHCPEQICEMTNVTPGDLVASVCKSIWEMKRNEVALISSIAQPQIISKLAKAAESKKNYKHTELFLRTAGMLPDKHGTAATGAPQVNINQNFAPLVQQGVDPNEQNIVVPSMDDDIVETSRQLAPPANENVLFMQEKPVVQPENH